MKSRSLALVAALVARLATWGFEAVLAQEPAAPTPEQRLGALKQSLQDSQTRLRQYEWIETTIISLKGEERGRKQQRCYYGADGKIQKLPIAGAPEPEAEQSGGRRGGRIKAAIIENKKDDMRDYMERAAALIHQYVPPSPEQIQKVKDAGRMAVNPLGKGRFQIEFRDYLQPGDRLAVEVDAAANNLAGLSLSTYLDEPDEVVQLAVQFATLNDGTSYTAQTTLDAKAKNIRVVVQNSGHKPMAAGAPGAR